MRQYPFIYSQRDPAWASQRLGTVNGATIGQYGCILTCQAMKAGYYGHEIKPNALDDIFTNKNIYVQGDLLPDSGVHAVFNDIQLVEVKTYTSGPADLNYLKQLAADPAVTVTIEVDFDHDPNDGIQTHFVELHDYDGTTLTIYDPWYGQPDNFTTHYGTNPAVTIQKFAIYKGNAAKAQILVDQDVFQELVNKSTSNDAVCDALGLAHNVGKDAEVATISKIKLDSTAKDTTITNLNKQIPELEGKISTLDNQVLDLQQKLQIAQAAAVHPDTGIDYQVLYTQSQADLSKLRVALGDLQTKYNKTVAQYQNTSALLMPKKQLWKIVASRLFT